MAAWHVPVHDESVSEDILEDDLFEDNLEQTFPPLRYCAINQTRRPSKKLRRDSSRERERLYRELVGHAPYVVKQQSPRDDRFYIALDVKHYKPEEITIKVDGKIRTPSERLIDVQLVSFFQGIIYFLNLQFFFLLRKPGPTQPATTCSKLTIEILEQGVKICLKLTIRRLERRHWRRSGVFIVNLEHISHLVLWFLLLTLSR